MGELIERTCPNCGGKMKVAGDVDKLICPYCGTEFLAVPERVTPDAWEYRGLYVDLTTEGQPTRFDGFYLEEGLWKYLEPRVLAELNRWTEQGWELVEQELSGRLLDFTYRHNPVKTVLKALVSFIGLEVDDYITLVKGASLHIRRRKPRPPAK